MWEIWIDTGGTFTDCIGRDPDGKARHVKVLSSSTLRGEIIEVMDNRTLRVGQNWNAPSKFVNGFAVNILGTDHDSIFVDNFNAEHSTITLDQPLTRSPNITGSNFEVLSDEEAPVLGCRLLTQTLPGTDFPPLKMRLATTKGTNALLEKKGAPTLLLITKGFGDLLEIGDQKRPDIFALEVEKPDPLYAKVIEIDERMDSNGTVLKNMNFDENIDQFENFLTKEGASVAVCLMHGYKNDDHEKALHEHLKKLGAEHVSLSSELTPFIKILPRAHTTLVNAYLQPILQEYLNKVKSKIHEGSLHVMTSAGGLVNSNHFHPKDSLLSGPAGGVVGASTIGMRAGFKNVISFDMGGTSTDVARYDDGFDYVYEYQVGDARLNAPAVSIETVAAGGGSICSFDGNKLTVGPESAGAFPGPACYGAGGPLTVTDVNLLLGRLDPDNFGIPITLEESEQKLNELIRQIEDSGHAPRSREEILEGLIHIANERMADAIRKISLREGYDPSDYALVAFGGAGAQHACAIAIELGMEHILIPSQAGLLSAYGLGHALIEQFAEKQVMQSLSRIENSLQNDLKDLEKQATSQLRRQENIEDEIQIRRRLVYMRLSGQESTIEVPFTDNLEEAFIKAYKQRYGHWIEGRDIEVESIRVVASTKETEIEFNQPRISHEEAEARKEKSISFHGQKQETPVFDREQIGVGNEIEGPALILDPYSTILLEPGWNAEVREDRTLHLVKKKTTQTKKKSHHSEAVALELFTNRFTAIAGEMGEMLKRTALSVNVKERMDFSCALLNARGELVVNAPHIPVHLGAMGLCVRKLKEHIEMNPGDVIVTNHPAFGGSHLPDITVVTPVYADNQQTLIGYAASRAHHAEIGGNRPGSMPPDATSLIEEGVVIPPRHLVKAGKEQWESIRKILTEARYPTRSLQENIADLQAALAANHRGVESLKTLADKHGSDLVLSYMAAIKEEAATKARDMISELSDGTYSSEEYLDDGSLLKAGIKKSGSTLSIDFKGTSGVHPGNLNATPAIVSSVIMYVIRVLIDKPLPLNEGLLEPVSIHLPKCMLNPDFQNDPERCPAIVGGNTETSQRLVDLLLKPFDRISCSQGTMNNVLFGNEKFGYYETVGGGTGAGPGFSGANGVHHHMTNTAGTDPEILEHRYPVRLNRYAIRKNSGGEGTFRGGDGIERELTFLEPVSLSVLTQHRKEEPYGLKGGRPGKKGKQWIERAGGGREELYSIDGKELGVNDRFILQTPGGGGYGSD